MANQDHSKGHTLLARSNTFQGHLSSFLAHLKAIQSPISVFTTWFLPEDLELTEKIFETMPGIVILQLKEVPIRTGDMVSVKLVSRPFTGGFLSL